MISILIPTYNYSVSRLVETLHEQAIKTDLIFEILVFEDGSTAFVSENEKLNSLEHVNYRKPSENIGRAAIRAELANAAKYDMLLFLDADTLPVMETFIEEYAIRLNTRTDVICGGIAYKDEAPEQSRMLRYKYGKARESKSSRERSKNAEIIVTANMLIRREIFNKCNTELENFYGEDLLISHRLKTINAKVEHIDNPVWHLGLEESEDYLDKAFEAIQNIVRLEKKGKIDSGLTSLQKAYKKLKTFGMTKAYLALLNPFSKSIRKNLISAHPSLFLFDLYRLKYYIELKRNG